MRSLAAQTQPCHPLLKSFLTVFRCGPKSLVSSTLCHVALSPALPATLSGTEH